MGRTLLPADSPGTTGLWVHELYTPSVAMDKSRHSTAKRIACQQASMTLSLGYTQLIQF